MTKQQLRKQYLNRRRQLTVAEYEQLSRQLLLQFQKLNLDNVHCIHLFYPMKERKEPDTLMIRDWVHTHHSDIKIVFPKSDFSTLTMQSFADDDKLKLETNSYGITEPVEGNMIPAEEIDLVIIPLLIFDRQGYRVGYGKGFYDRFLTQCKPGTRFIGLSFFEPVEKIEDMNEFDIKMHVCLTPTGVWKW